MSSFMQDFYDGSRSVGRAKANENLKNKIQKLKIERREKGLHKKWRIEIKCWTKNAKSHIKVEKVTVKGAVQKRKEKKLLKIVS